MDRVGGEERIELSNAPSALDDGFEDHDWARHRIRGDFLAEAIRASAQRNGLTIVGAWIPSGLDLRRAELAPLTLARSRVDGVVLLDGATLTTLNLDGSSFSGLSMRWARIDELLARRARCRGLLMLSPLHVGHMDLGGTHISRPNDVAIDANVLTSDRSININRGVRVEGRVRFIGAKIGGQLNFRESHFEGHDGAAVSLHEATVTRSLYLRGSTFNGKVDLSGSSIGGRVDARGAVFHRNRGLAIDMKGSRVDRGIQLDGAQVDGELRIVAGRAGAYLRARKHRGRHARFVAPTLRDIERYGEGRDDLDPLSGSAVLIERTTIARDITLSDGTEIQGLVVRRCEVGDDLRLEGAVLLAAPSGLGLDASGTGVGGALILHQAQESSGSIDLSHASVQRLDDRLPWSCDELDIDGFTYRAIVGRDPRKEVDLRLEWLRAQRTFSGQPYEQLASVYRTAGYPDQARTVLWRRDVDLRKEGRLTLPSRLASWIFGSLVGHGYRLHRALGWLLVLWLGGAFVLHGGWDRGAVDLAGRKPEDQRVRCPVAKPCFSPLLLSLDLVVPIVEVGQQSSWIPTRQPWQTIAAGQAAAGWALTTAAVAGYARKIQRQ